MLQRLSRHVYILAVIWTTFFTSIRVLRFDRISDNMMVSETYVVDSRPGPGDDWRRANFWPSSWVDHVIIDVAMCPYTVRTVNIQPEAGHVMTNEPVVIGLGHMRRSGPWQHDSSFTSDILVSLSSTAKAFSFLLRVRYAEGNSDMNFSASVRPSHSRYCEAQHWLSSKFYQRLIKRHQFAYLGNKRRNEIPTAYLPTTVLNASRVSRYSLFVPNFIPHLYLTPPPLLKIPHWNYLSRLPGGRCAFGRLY